MEIIIDECLAKSTRLVLKEAGFFFKKKRYMINSKITQLLHPLLFLNSKN